MISTNCVFALLMKFSYVFLSLNILYVENDIDTKYSVLIKIKITLTKFEE